MKYYTKGSAGFDQIPYQTLNWCQQMGILKLCNVAMRAMHHTTERQTDSCLHYKHGLCSSRQMAQDNPDKRHCLFHNSTSRTTPQENIN